jgi:hypothetical protein
VDPEEPIDATLRLLLREEVGSLRARESRRRFDASVQVGILGGARAGFVLRAKDRPVMDAALLRDVASRLVEGSPSSWRHAWLVRPGTVEPHDLDLHWLAAARAAFGSVERPLGGCFVVTRSGWRDVVTDDGHAWVRLRL